MYPRNPNNKKQRYSHLKNAHVKEHLRFFWKSKLKFFNKKMIIGVNIVQIMPGRVFRHMDTILWSQKSGDKEISENFLFSGPWYRF